MAAEISSPSIDRALDGLAEFFYDRQTRPGVVARRILGITRADDHLLVDQLISERRRRTRMDGGVSGWVVGTTWAALELMQLGCPPDHTGVSRMIGYLIARQDLPGRFGEGADGKYEFGPCAVPMRGFFSPSNIDEPIAPLTFPSGAILTVEWEARFASSCFALRAVLQARQERRDQVRSHLDSLFAVAEGWQAGTCDISHTLLFFMIAAFAMAPLSDRARASGFVQALAAAQQDDGGWPNVPIFHAVDAMLLMPMPDAFQAVRNAGEQLIARQRPSGGFDDTDDEELALIALRGLASHGIRRSRTRPVRTSAPTLSQRRT